MKPPLIQVFDGSTSDAIALTTLVGQYWREHEVLSKTEFDAVTTVIKAREALRDGYTFIGMAWAGLVPAGVLWCRQAENLGNTQMYATDRLVYVAPEYRGSTAFKQLYSLFESWLEQRNIKEVRTATFGSSNNGGLKAFLLSKGYKLMGETFYLERK